MHRLEWRKGAGGAYEAITPDAARACIIVRRDTGGDKRFTRTWTLVIVKRHADGAIYQRLTHEGIATLAQAKGLAPAMLSAIQSA